MAATDIAIIGAGLTGLCCARRLLREGVSCQVFEASDRVGGRVATDRVDGFLLDHGFQVFLTSYPEARDVLDYDALDLRSFTSGALVRMNGRNRRIVDAWRQPLRALAALAAPVLPLGDIPRVLRLRRSALRHDRVAADVTASEYLAGLGFSESAMQRFFRPFFGGVTLDRSLAVPANYFLFLFEMFARGSATLPRAGMQAIPEQLAAGLPEGTIRLGARVRSLADHVLTLDSGERVEADHVIVATDAHGSGQLSDDCEVPQTNGTTTIYYGADASPLDEPILLLNTDDQSGPVHHICFPSDVQPSYAPAGAALASVTVIGIPDRSDAELDRAVRRQLRGWFGAATDGWQLLRIDRLPRALPQIATAEGTGFRRLSEHLTICGDHLLTPSIQGAMVSGRHAAEAVMQSRS